MKWIKIAMIAGVVVVGVAIASRYPVVQAVKARITEQIDECSSVDDLIRRVEAALRADHEKLGKASGAFQQLQNKLAGILVQREHCCQQLQQTQAVTQYIVAQLEKPGETIEIHDGMSRSRVDVEEDLATYTARGNEQEAELQRLDEDEDRLDQLRLKRELIVVVDPIRPLLKHTASSTSSSLQREYDHVAQLLQTRFQEIPKPAPVTDTPWRELVVQKRPADPVTQSVPLTANQVVCR